ncbi:hypothetical protein LEMLEM_LOCUS21601, partial [Lemmus lemmus]
KTSHHVFKINWSFFWVLKEITIINSKAFSSKNLGLEGSGHGPASAGRASICKETLGSSRPHSGELSATLEASPFYWMMRVRSKPWHAIGRLIAEDVLHA